MNYDIKCKFFCLDREYSKFPKIISEGWMNELKCFNNGKYEILFDDIDEILNFDSDNLKSLYTKSEYSYKFSLNYDVEMKWFDKKGSVLDFCRECGENINFHTNYGGCYCFDDEHFEILSKLDHTKKLKKDYINVYLKKTVEENGKFYDINSFKYGYEKYIKKLADIDSKIFGLSNVIEKDVEYFKLTDEQKNEMKDTLYDMESERESCVNKIKILYKMISLFEYYECNEIVNDEGDERNLKIYCFISIV